MILTKSALTIFLALPSLTSATGLRWANWGCSSSLRDHAPITEKNLCSGSGSFFIEFGGKAICSSGNTRKPPSKDLVCPRGWSEHKQFKVCLPPKEVSDCDCGEGFGWVGGSKKCNQNSHDKCKKGQWYHDRSDSCCDDSWEWNPPKGDCDKGKRCPTDWFWHKGLKKCKPHHKREPWPDCDDWNEKEQCCGGHGPEPSKKPSNNGGHGGGGGHGGHGGHGDNGGSSGHGGYGGHGGKGGWKRDFLGRQQSVNAEPKFPVTDMDKMYCPKGLHACSVITPAGGEWSYECIDFASELESCGGCASAGEGQDCTTIENAISVGCENGLCAVYSCEDGFAANGTACVSFNVL